MATRKDCKHLRKYNLLKGVTLRNLLEVRFLHLEVTDGLPSTKDIAFMVTHGGDVYGIGSYQFGRLAQPVRSRPARNRQLCTHLAEHNFIGFSVSRTMVLGWTEEMNLVGWGAGMNFHSVYLPSQILPNQNVIKAFCGERSFALCENGLLFSWSNNMNIRVWPFTVTNRISDFCAANNMIAAITTSNELVTCTYISYNNENIPYPKRWKVSPVVKIFASKVHFVAVTSITTFYTWGADGSPYPLVKPTEVTGFSHNLQNPNVFTGSTSSRSIVQANGKLYTWIITDRRQTFNADEILGYDSLIAYLARKNISTGCTMRLGRE